MVYLINHLVRLDRQRRAGLTRQGRPAVHAPRLLGPPQGAGAVHRLCAPFTHRCIHTLLAAAMLMTGMALTSSCRRFAAPTHLPLTRMQLAHCPQWRRAGGRATPLTSACCWSAAALCLLLISVHTHPARSGGVRAGHAFDFSLLLMPRRSAVAEQLLEEQGILGDVAIRWVVVLATVGTWRYGGWWCVPLVEWRCTVRLPAVALSKLAAWPPA